MPRGPQPLLIRSRQQLWSPPPRGLLPPFQMQFGTTLPLVLPPSPTFVHLAIHSLTISLMPYEDSILYDELHESILNSYGVSISATRFLNPDRSSRVEKRAFFVVVNVDPTDIQTLLPSLDLFGG